MLDYYNEEANQGIQVLANRKEEYPNTFGIVDSSIDFDKLYDGNKFPYWFDSELLPYLSKRGPIQYD